ncbi:hypothetical protein BH23PLA1_BH23PLA1_44780 [soil metagenome]
MTATDDIGLRGESIFVVRITEPCGPDQSPLFRPHFLGEKFPTLDHLVELVGLEGRSAYFFAQVKTTTRGCTTTPPQRLRVSVSQVDINRMLVYPAPTYVIGIDERTEQAYIGSVNGIALGRIASLPTTYPLNSANLQVLWSEVERFWRRKKMILNNSAFMI